MKKKTIICLILILLLVPCVIGAKFTYVELKGTDHSYPLVKLDAIIEMGGSFVAGTDTYADDQQGKQREEHTGTVTTAPGRDSEADIVIRVYGKGLYINGRFTVEDVFDKQFSAVYGPGKTVILLDDYADYLAYNRMTDYLDGKSIVYTVKRTE